MGRPVGSGTGGRPSLVRKTTSLAFPQEYWDWMMDQDEPQAELLRLAIALLRERREGKTKKSVKGL
jgi:hypothetical protein